MREIWFRGKRLFSHGYNDAWIEGGFHQRDGKSYIIGISKNYRIDGCEVDPETVGQYTGLTVNGTKIFEGDIVAGAVHWLERYKNGVVAFRDGSFGLIWHRGDIEQFNAFTSMCNVEYEVIGNIHDNPELLEGREKNMKIIKAPAFEISTCRRCGTVFQAEPGDKLIFLFKRGVAPDPIEAIDTACPVCNSHVRLYPTYKEESDEL